MRLSDLQRRRWANFRANRRAFWSLCIFLGLYVLSLGAEFIANDRPILMSHRGELYFPVFGGTYMEEEFGGDPGLIAQLNDPLVQCLVVTGGLEACFGDAPAVMADAGDGEVAGEAVAQGWMLWPPVPYSFNTINYGVGQAPSAPDADHWLGTDDQTRDVFARILYGFRISVTFALIVAGLAALIGIAAGAVQGYFGGWLDLIFQRIVEIWSSTPTLYVIIIVAAIIPMNFAILCGLIILFSWTGLVGVVRAEFLRARNFEYVRAARALGVPDRTIIARHVLPNAMVATLTFLPFLITGTISSLAVLDYLGFGLPPAYPSLGELALQGKNYITKPWLGFAAFFTFALMLSLLVFIFEGVRDAFDPRKVFR
jgi:microcin C transport system permease protein